MRGRQKRSFGQLGCSNETEITWWLGIGNLLMRNRALLGKWLCRFPL